jgi:hypothetical protein
VRSSSWNRLVFGDKQKLRMLQNTVGDVAALSYVKQLGDQDIAHVLPPLTYGSYFELLLSACSTTTIILVPLENRNGQYMLP